MGDMEWNTSNAGSEVFCVAVDVAGVAFRLYAPAPSVLQSRTCTFPFAHDVVNNCPSTILPSSSPCAVLIRTSYALMLSTPTDVACRIDVALFTL